MNIKKKLVFSIILLTSCFEKKQQFYKTKQCSNQSNTYIKYEKCDLTNIQDYYDVIVDNSAKSNKVILYLVGGPSNISPGKQMRDNIQNYRWAKTAKDHGVSYYLINQSQWLKANKFVEGDVKKMTLAQAYQEHMETVDNTHKVIKYLKSQGKQVGLIGHSYGSLLVNEYLAKYGDDIPDFILSVATRLKIKNTKEVSENLEASLLKKDREIKFSKDDKILIEKLSNPKYSQYYSTPKNQIETAIKFAIPAITKDYTKVINDKDLSKTKFLSAAPDGKIGWFNQEEISWARARKASVDFFTEEQTSQNYEIAYPDQTLTKDEVKNELWWFGHYVGEWTKAQAKKYIVDSFNK